MSSDRKDDESIDEWLNKVRKSPCSKLTKEWFGCDDQETDMTSSVNSTDQENELGKSVFLIDPKGDVYLP